MWIGESDEKHEQMTKGTFDLGQYRDLSKKQLNNTIWNGAFENYMCQINIRDIVYVAFHNRETTEFLNTNRYNYTKEGDYFVLKKCGGWPSEDFEPQYSNLEINYVNSTSIKIRNKGTSTWYSFSSGVYNPTPTPEPDPEVDLASFLKGTTWEMKEDGELLSITFDSNGKKGVFISANGDEEDDEWDPDDGGNFTYTVSSDKIVVDFDDIDHDVKIKVINDNQISITSPNYLWGNVTLQKVTNALKASNVTGTWKYKDEDGETWTIYLASTGKGYLKYDGDKENIYWALSGRYILIMDEDYKEPEYVLTVYSYGSNYLKIYYDELGEAVTFKK